MRKFVFSTLLALVGAGALLLTGGRAAEEKEKEKPIPAEEKAKQEAQAEEATLLAEAAHLAEIGAKYKSPEAYITAGLLVRRVAAHTEGKLPELTAKVTVLDDKGAPIASPKIETRKPTSLDDLAQGYFDSATQLGLELKTSKEIDALVKAAKARTFEGRGAFGGPRRICRVLSPGESHRYDFEFAEHGVAAVSFEAEGRCHWELRAGRDVLFELGGRNGHYDWEPRREHRGHYEFTVRNEERRPVEYRLFTN